MFINMKNKKSINKFILVLSILSCLCLIISSAFISNNKIVEATNELQSVTLNRINDASKNGYVSNVECLSFDGFSGNTFFLVEFEGQNVPNFAVKSNITIKQQNGQVAITEWNGENYSNGSGILLCNSSLVDAKKLHVANSFKTSTVHNSSKTSFPKIDGYAPGLSNFDNDAKYLMIIGYESATSTSKNIHCYIFLIDNNQNLTNVYHRVEEINTSKSVGSTSVIYGNINVGENSISFKYVQPQSSLNGLFESLSEQKYKKQLINYFTNSNPQIGKTITLNKVSAQKGIASSVENISFNNLSNSTYFLVQFKGQNMPNFAVNSSSAYSAWNAENSNDAGLLFAQSYEGGSDAIIVSNGLNTLSRWKTINSTDLAIDKVGVGLSNLNVDSEYVMLLGVEPTHVNSSNVIYYKFMYYLFTLDNKKLELVSKYDSTITAQKNNQSNDIAVIYGNINDGADNIIFNYVEPQNNLNSLIDLIVNADIKAQLNEYLSSYNWINASMNRIDVDSDKNAENVEFIEFGGFNSKDAYLLLEFNGKNVPNFAFAAQQGYSQFNKENSVTGGYMVTHSSVHGQNKMYVYSGVGFDCYNYSSTETLPLGLNFFDATKKYIMLVGYDYDAANPDKFICHVYEVDEFNSLTAVYEGSQSLAVPALAGDKIIVYPNMNNGLKKINFKYLPPSTTIAGVVGNLSSNCEYKDQLIDKYSLNVLTVNVVDEKGMTIRSLGVESDGEFIFPNSMGIENFIGWDYNGKIYQPYSTAVIRENCSIKAICLDFYLEAGASLRVEQNENGYGGMRFALKTNTVQYEKIKDYIKFYGIITPTDNIDDNFNVVDGGRELNPFELVYSKSLSNGYTVFNLTITNILLSNYNRAFSACAYAEITYANNEVQKVQAKYDKTLHSRSVYDLAKSYYNSIGGDLSQVEEPELKMLLEYLDSTVNLSCSIIDGDFVFGALDGLEEIKSYTKPYSVSWVEVENLNENINRFTLGIKINIEQNKFSSSDNLPHIPLTIWFGENNSIRVKAKVVEYDGQEAILLFELECTPELYYGSSKNDFEYFGYSGTCDDWYTRDGVTTLLPESLCNQDSIKLYKDSGLNVLYVGNAYNYNGRTTSFESSELKRVMDLAYNQGLKCVIFEQNLYNLSLQNSSIIGRIVNNFKFSDQETLVKYVQSCLEEVIKHPAFYGVSLDDEPSYKQFDAMGEIYRAIQEVYPGTYVQVNLWAYAESWAFDAENIYCSNYADFDSPEKIYVEYLRLFNEKVGNGMIMYDDYPLCQKNGDNFVLNNHLLTLKLVSEFATENNLRFVKVFQSSGYSDKTSTIRRAPTYIDMLWQTNLGMAMGVKTFAYWSYYPIINTSGEYYDSNSSFVDELGNPNDLYYYMQKIHADMKHKASVMSSFEFNSVNLKINGTPYGRRDYLDNLLKVCDGKFKIVSDFSVSEKGAVLISELYDTQLEQYGYYIVNPTDSTVLSEQTIVIKFDNCENLCVYANGTTTTVDLIDGKYTLNLSTGDGVFVLPY